MASIAKIAGSKFADGHDRWRTQYRDGTGKQVVKQFRTRRDAEQHLKDVFRDGDDLRDSRAGRQTLAELWDEVHAARRFAPKTLEIHAGAWKSVPEAVRRAPIAQIDAATIDRVLARVKGPASRDKLRAVLSMVFNWAIAKRRITSNPAKKSGIRATREERMETGGHGTEKRYLDADELRRLVEATPERYRAMVRLMAHVGLRPGEAYAVTAGQFDPLTRTLRIDGSISGPTKTGDSRTIRLPAVVSELLIEHVTRFVDDPTDSDALLFGTIEPNNWRRRVFAPAARAAGVDRLRVNDLRHTAVSFAIGHGASVYDVQRMVGHAKPSITLDVYGELWDAGADRLAERLDEAIRAVL